MRCSLKRLISWCIRDFVWYFGIHLLTYYYYIGTRDYSPLFRKLRIYCIALAILAWRKKRIS